MKSLLSFLFVVSLTVVSQAQDRIIVVETSPVIKVYPKFHHRFSRDRAGHVNVGVDMRRGRIITAGHQAGWRFYNHNRHAYRNLRNVAWSVRSSTFPFRERARVFSYRRGVE
jgi:hypothetical protein